MRVEVVAQRSEYGHFDFSGVDACLGLAAPPFLRRYMGYIISISCALFVCVDRRHAVAPLVKNAAGEN